MILWVTREGPSYQVDQQDGWMAWPGPKPAGPFCLLLVGGESQSMAGRSRGFRGVALEWGISLGSEGTVMLEEIVRPKRA